MCTLTSRFWATPSPYIWPNGFLRRQGNSQGSGYAPIDFLLFTDTSQGRWSCPDDLFPSVLPGYRKMFLADWLFRRSCASFQLVFCDVPHVDVFLMCLWEKVISIFFYPSISIPLLPHSTLVSFLLLNCPNPFLLPIAISLPCVSCALSLALHMTISFLFPTYYLRVTFPDNIK